MRKILGTLGRVGRVLKDSAHSALRPHCAALLAAILLAMAVSHQRAAAAIDAVAAKPADDDMLSGLTFASQRGPVTISAKELEFDYRSRTLTYRGSVQVTQADLTLNSDRLRVKIDENAKDKIREIEAEGHVRVAQGDRVATGGRAVFDQATRTVVLSDDAVLRQGLNEVAGERVVVYLDEQRSVVEGGKQRVRAVLFPPKKDSEPKDTAADAPASGDAAAAVNDEGDAAAGGASDDSRGSQHEQ